MQFIFLQSVDGLGRRIDQEVNLSHTVLSYLAPPYLSKQAKAGREKLIAGAESFGLFSIFLKSLRPLQVSIF